MLNLPANSSPVNVCTRVMGTIGTNRISFGRMLAFGVSRCMNLPRSRPRDCRSFVTRGLFSRVSYPGRGVRVLGNGTRSLRTRYTRCRRVVTRTNNVSLFVNNVNPSNRVTFGRPFSSLGSHAHIGALAASAHVTGSHFFNNSVGTMPTATLAMNINAIVTTERIVVLYGNRGGTHTLRTTVRNPIART